MDAAAILMVLALGACHSQPGREVAAEVVAIDPSESRLHPENATITFATLAGLRTRLILPRATIRCRIGDAVPAHAQGIALSIDGRPCG